MKLRQQLAGMAMLLAGVSTLTLHAQPKTTFIRVGSREGSDISFHELLGNPKLKNGQAEVATPFDAAIKGEIEGQAFTAVIRITAQGNKLNFKKGSGLACNGRDSLCIHAPGPITFEFQSIKSDSGTIIYTGMREFTVKAKSGNAKFKTNKSDSDYTVPKGEELTVEYEAMESKKALSITRVAKSMVLTELGIKFATSKQKKKSGSKAPSDETLNSGKNSGKVTVRREGSELVWKAKTEKGIKEYRIVKAGEDTVIETIPAVDPDEYRLEVVDDAGHPIDAEVIVIDSKGKKQRVSPAKK